MYGVCVCMHVFACVHSIFINFYCLPLHIHACVCVCVCACVCVRVCVYVCVVSSINLWRR